MSEKKSFTWNRVIMVLLHLAGWATFLLYPFFNTPRFMPGRGPGQGPPPGGGPEHIPLDMNSINNLRIPQLVYNLLLLVFFYVNIYFLIPKVLSKKGWIPYALCIVACFPVLYFVQWGIREAMGLGWFHAPPTFLFLTFLVAFAFSTSLRLTSDRIQFDRERKERENENLKSELSFLRSQVSPHFMFNVLNSLASLARKKSDELEPVIIQLSLLMRYMLYDSGGNKVALEKEVEYLKSYIDLQKLRFGADVTVHFHVALENRDMPIEPMLLIPFVENAFKHGIGMVQDPLIEIHLSSDQHALTFKVRNKFNKKDDRVKDSNSGIGLNNVVRRLNLLYKDLHQLTTTTQEDWFVVELKLILS